MRILVVGADAKASFEIRGRQLGHAVGARVTNQPVMRDWQWADVIVLVKRAAMVWGSYAKRFAKAPIIWDVVDCWQQPEENQVPLEDLKRRMLEIRDAIGATTLIGATDAMARDLGGIYLPHHSRRGLVPAPPSAKAESKRPLRVGYEGQTKYLGPWMKTLEATTARMGFTFVVNPPDLRAVDVVVAFRGGRWDGPVCRQWKSGVKYVNALVAGRPVITQPCAGFADVAPIGADIEDPSLLAGALGMTSAAVRQLAYDDGVKRARDFSLETVARRYREIITHAVRAAA